MTGLIIAAIMLGIYWLIAGFATMLMLLENESKTTQDIRGDILFAFASGGALLPATLIYKIMKGK